MTIFAGRIFEGRVETVSAFCAEEMPAALARVQELSKKFEVVGYIAYEAKDFFLGRPAKSATELLHFDAFERSRPLPENFPPAPKNAPQMEIEPQISYAQYASALAHIKGELTRGNTYQVNFTYPVSVKTDATPAELFAYLRRFQNTEFAALIEGGDSAVVSLSPELFFSLKGGVLTARPMKGTAPRSTDGAADAAAAQVLPLDPKNRAENLMIVDLLRNDMGAISKAGSVSVDRLFSVETYPTAHQMVSEITSRFEGEASLEKILRALFPCGSITGAPKISTMQIIDALEKFPRGVYCGAIGRLNSDGWTFSVPIRTLQKRRGENFYVCGVGGGITWGSTAAEEWLETKTKTRFLHGEMRIVETLAVANSKPLFLDEHATRMAKSAQFFGFEFDAKKFAAAVRLVSQDCMLRVLLSRSGALKTRIVALSEAKTDIVEISPITLRSDEVLLSHKTTWRPWFDDAMRRIRLGEVYDELFFNEHGQLCEGARTNVAVEIGGELFTPPARCGLLCGVYRAKLLSDGLCSEKIITRADLLRAEKIYCFNSVRGMKRVRLKL